VKRFLSYLLLLTILVICISGCNATNLKIEDVNIKEEYGRKNVAEMVDTPGFGDGRTDAMYVALDYIYNSEEIKNVCGDTFEVSLSNIITHNDEAEYLYSYRYFIGVADYTVEIDEYNYRIKLSKERFSGWHVDECFLEKE